MKLARGLERRLERLVDGIAARLFKGSYHPVELATRLVRAADLAVVDSDRGPVVPNRFSVHLPEEPIEAPLLGKAQRELAEVVGETFTDRGWRVEGPVHVGLLLDGAIDLEVDTNIEAGDLPAWARLIPSEEGPPLTVHHNRALIGRSGNCDVHIPDAEVSRRHALLWREAGRVWVTDLGSSNGVSVNGEQIGAKPVEVSSGDAIGLGERVYLLRLGD